MQFAFTEQNNETFYHTYFTSPVNPSLYAIQQVS